MLNKLEDAKPYWTPGERNGYSAGIVGAYMRELVQRIDPHHRTFGQYFQEEIALPLNAEFYIGLPDSIPNERIAYNKVLGVFDRLGSLFKLPWGMITTVINPWSLFMKSITQVDGYDVNDRNTWRVEEPSGNGIGTARGAALIYSEFATGGVRLKIGTNTLKELTDDYLKTTKGSTDMVMGVDMYYRNGFVKNGPKNIVFANSESFGFGGASGSMAFADPENRIGYCYVPNLMGDDFPDSRNDKIQKALYNCLASLQGE
jgi:CubicO group peptidase (beta-lactamase class C family)